MTRLALVVVLAALFGAGCDSSAASAPPQPQATSVTTASPTPEPMAAVKYVAYANDRFAFTVERPAHFKPGPEPMNGDGLQFFGPNGGVMTASGMFDMHEGDISAAFVSTKEHSGVTVTYEVKKADWFVISGTKGDSIVYTKTLIRDGREVTVHFEYPAALKAEFDPIVGHAVKTLKALPFQ